MVRCSPRAPTGSCSLRPDWRSPCSPRRESGCPPPCAVRPRSIPRSSSRPCAATAEGSAHDAAHRRRTPRRRSPSHSRSPRRSRGSPFAHDTRSYRERPLARARRGEGVVSMSSAVRLRGLHDEHAARQMMAHLVGHRSQPQEPRHTGHPTVTEHEEVVPALATGLDQRPDRLTLRHTRIDVDAGGLVASRL